MHRQFFRKGDLAIYQRSKRIGAVVIQHFEVVIVQHHPAFSIRGVDYEGGECYPGAKDWGWLGWTCFDEDAAWTRLRAVRKLLKLRTAAPS